MREPCCAVLLLIVLVAATLVAWSPAYWPVALLQVGIFLIGMAVVWGKPRWNRLFLPMGLAGVWGLLQLALGASVYRFQTMRALLYWSANAVVMFIAAQCLRRPRVRANFLTALAAFMGVMAVIGILQYFTAPYRVYWTFPVAHQAVGPFVYRNQFAAMVELLMPIALYRAMNERRRRWPYAILAAVMFAVVIATASRAGTLLVAGEFVVVFALAWRRRLVSGRSISMALAQVMALALAFTLVVGFHQVWSRLQESNPYALRGKLALSTLRMIRTRPVLGYGLGTWQTVYPEFATFDNSLFANEAHNDWLQWTAEGGIPFGLALALVAAGSAVLAWRRIWGVGVVFLFVHSLIDYPTREPVVGAILFVLIGAMIAGDGEATEAAGHGTSTAVSATDRDSARLRPSPTALPAA